MRKRQLILFVSFLGGCQKPSTSQQSTPALGITISSDGTRAHALAYDSNFLSDDCDGNNSFVVCVGSTCTSLPPNNGGLGCADGCGRYWYEGDVPIAADNDSYTVNWNGDMVLTVTQPPSFVAPPTPSAPVSRSTTFSFDWLTSPAATASWSDPFDDCITSWDINNGTAPGGLAEVLPIDWQMSGDIDVTLCLNESQSGKPLAEAPSGSWATATQTRGFLVHTIP